LARGNAEAAEPAPLGGAAPVGGEMTQAINTNKGANFFLILSPLKYAAWVLPLNWPGALANRDRPFSVFSGFDQFIRCVFI
jgi:hypothetical protein